MEQLKTNSHRFYAYIECANFTGYEIEGEWNIKQYKDYEYIYIMTMQTSI